MEEAKNLKESRDKEVQICIDKWSDYLNDLDDDYRRGEIAVLLENQRLYQEVSDFGFGELGFKLIYEIYKDFVGFEMVSVQTMMKPVDIYFNYNDSEILGYKEIVALTRKLKTVGNKESLPDFALSIKEEIEREIFVDLANSAGTVTTLEKTDPTGEDLYIKLMAISGIIHVKTLISNLPMWVVTNPDWAEKLKSYTFLEEKNKPIKDSIYYWGVLNNAWKLIVDPLYPANQMLVGFNGPYKSGYAYCPYVALTKTPVINIEGLCPRPGILVRYGKQLREFGSKYYCKIVLK